MNKKIESIKTKEKDTENDAMSRQGGTKAACADLKNINDGIKQVKGAFDAVPGGAKLESISNADMSPTARTIDSLKVERDRLQKEFDELPKPRGDAKIKRRRYYVNKKIKDIEKKMDSMQKAKLNKDPVDLSDAEKYENLAKQIGYKHTPLGLLDRVQFELEKKNILDKADKIFNDQAKIISDYLVMMSHVTDGYECVSGYSMDLTKGKDRLQLQVKKCLIHEGMKGNQFADAFSNPYIGLSMAIGMPLFARYSYNRAHPIENSEKKNTQKPKTNQELLAERIQQNQHTGTNTIKVDMGNKTI